MDQTDRPSRLPYLITCGLGLGGAIALGVAGEEFMRHPHGGPFFIFVYALCVSAIATVTGFVCVGIHLFRRRRARRS